MAVYLEVRDAFESLHCRGLWQARRVQRAHHRHPWRNDDREVIQKAVAGCDGVLTVLVPWGAHHYSSGTAQAVLDHARPGARLIFSCGWHITRDGHDVYSRGLSGHKGHNLAHAACSRRGYRRPGGSVSAGVCQRHPVDGRAWERS